LTTLPRAGARLRSKTGTEQDFERAAEFIDWNDLKPNGRGVIDFPTNETGLFGR
jgi:hypothetical protein